MPLEPLLITDARANAAEAPELLKEAASLGITIFGLGIEVKRERLAPWCDQPFVIHDLDLSTMPDEIAASLFAA